MSFNIGLSGLRAASKDLNITGNNIANAGTAGFKQSRAEFSDVYTASILGGGSVKQGSGVLLSNVSQLFNQGNINYTQNVLDLAINGNGFFQVSNNGALSYTRAGYFGTDREGYIVDNFGYNLQGYLVDANGVLQPGVVGNLRVDATNQEPRATSQAEQRFNLNSRLSEPVNGPFSPTDPTTYNSSTSFNIYDTQGNAHVFSQYFVKTGPNQWRMDVLIDGAHPKAGEANLAAREVLEGGGTPAAVLAAALGALEDPSDFRSRIDAQVSPMLAAVPAPTSEDILAAIVRVGNNSPISMELEFDAAGKLQPIGASANVYDPNVNPAPPMTADHFWVINQDGTLTLRGNQWTPSTLSGDPAIPVANGALPNTEGMRLDIRGATQYSSSFAVNSVVQDGYTTGELAGLEVDENGMIYGRYTNGQSRVQGQLLLADFANVQGLTPVGKTQWVESLASGEPVRNPPRSGTLGAVQSGALEDSNVELSDQLVNLIVAQRNYQANAKTIETESAITQTIINLR
ncbi:flagellar hook protein FlgE [Pseudomonas sp. NCCP-436]|uniref:flagellar hook protein FlgE n=1 Tax=Pseudomonas sp. NCCP-436 TaxID=2842481 RepID=UPI001C80C86F|nr:flagellar hook protein FlgE [Pseudomonas sp. NCCP-436]GIZ13824.1 flagellar hook protein FlgE [Pseudomonas sp. NCCP-436]